MSYELSRISPRRQANGTGYSPAFYDPSLPGQDDPMSDADGGSTESSAKSIVLGGIDGITASYIIVAAAAGAKLHWSHVIILGCANILASAVSIGVSEFFSSKLHREFILNEKRRAKWQYKNYREDEIRQMVSRMEKHGMSKSDAEVVVNKFAMYEDVFVNMILVEELGMNLPDEDDGSSVTDAIIMLVSYALFGAIPVIVYLAGLRFDNREEDMFVFSTVISVCVLLILGGIKSTFSSSSLVYTAAETLFTTAACASVAFWLAVFLTQTLQEYHITSPLT